MHRAKPGTYTAAACSSDIRGTAGATSRTKKKGEDREQTPTFSELAERRACRMRWFGRSKSVPSTWETRKGRREDCTGADVCFAAWHTAVVILAHCTAQDEVKREP